MPKQTLQTQVLILWSKDAVYFDIPATDQTWNLNLDILYLEDENTYYNGTFDGEMSTTDFRRELQKIHPNF